MESPSSAPVLVVRADAGERMGAGHVMRCLALGQAWGARGGRTCFLTNCGKEALRGRIRAAGAEIQSLKSMHPDPRDLSETLHLLDRLRASAAGLWVALDGYQFDPAYQQAVRAEGHRLLVVDDLADQPVYHADALLNQNIYAPELEYRCAGRPRMLLGLEYALLRPEFVAWAGREKETPEVARRVLVTLGGGDAENVTLTVMRALERSAPSGVKARVVVGPANPHLATLREEARRIGRGWEILSAVEDMPGLMAWADLAISGAGSTSWELAFMRVPSLLIVVADNQRRIARALETAGAALSAGEACLLTPKTLAALVEGLVGGRALRASLSEKAGRLVDGRGAERVVEALCEFDSPERQDN